MYLFYAELDNNVLDTFGDKGGYLYLLHYIPFGGVVRV